MNGGRKLKATGIFGRQQGNTGENTMDAMDIESQDKFFEPGAESFKYDDGQNTAQSLKVGKDGRQGLFNSGQKQSKGFKDQDLSQLQASSLHVSLLKTRPRFQSNGAEELNANIHFSLTD